TPTRIPIFAITGTNGKTTTTRLIAHILRGTGKTVGFTTTDGTYIQNNKIVSGDNTGPVSAQLVLKDPTVDVAVLETARGGIIRSGLGYDHSDIAVVTNITADHLGSKDVNTLEDLARVKSVVPRSVSEEGFAILNAEDENVYQMRDLVEGKTVLFSMDENNKYIKKQIERNKISCVYENGYVTILKGQWKVRVEKVINIPLTFGGKAEFMIQNVLAATLACFVHGVSIADIRVGLTAFTPSTSQTPGRLNIVEIRDFTVLMDFAHNPPGFKGLRKFIENLNTTKLTGILSGVGDRRDEDIREMGKLSAETFDKLIIRRGDYLRGRTEDEVYNLFKEGIAESGREIEIEFIKESKDAIFRTFDTAQEGELVVILADTVSKDIAYVDEYREKIENN
ncbi:MAG: Mur ligase family protein, partial [Acidobacteriota bacterium]|nr:Mur ligase family protein [Acidobacteriota bacterium]